MSSVASADAGFIGQYNFATGTPVQSATQIRQHLGQLDNFTQAGSLHLYLSRTLGGSGTPTFGSIDFYCANTLSDMLSWTNSCGVWSDAFFSTATPTLDVSANLFILGASTTIPIDSTKYYSVGVNAGSGGSGGRRLFVWGHSTTTDPDFYEDGRCTRLSSGFQPCNNAHVDMGIEDIYFVLYGQLAGTRVITPDPYFNEVVAPTGTTTMQMTYGTIGYLDPTDGEDFRVVTDLTYIPGGLFPGDNQFWSDDENILGNGSYQVEYTNTINSTDLGKWRLSTRIIKRRDWLPDTLIYATSSYWYLGVNTDTASGTPNIYIDEVQESLESVDCEIDLTSVRNSISCIFEYVKAFVLSGVRAISDLFTDVFHYIVTRAPWGYAYRVYYLIQNPDVTYSLPTLSYTIPNGAGGGTFNADPWSIFAVSESLLDNATSSATTTSMLGGISYYFNIIVGLAFAWWVLHKILFMTQHGGFHRNSGRQVSNQHHGDN